MKDDPRPVDLSSRVALRPKEAATALGVSERTLRRWMRDRSLPYLRPDRGILIPVAGLMEWLAEQVSRESATDDLVDEILSDL